MLKPLLVMALAGVILLAHADPAPVQGQTPGGSPISLVSNFHGETTSVSVAFSALFAQGFMTGFERSILDGVSLPLRHVPANNARAVVSIHEVGADGYPELSDPITLTSPDPLANGINHFSAPDGTVLDANTPYMMVIDTKGANGVSIGFSTTTNQSELDGKAHGWSIADSALYRAPNGIWSARTFLVQMDVIGEEIIPVERIEVDGRHLRTVDSQNQFCWDDYYDGNNNGEADDVCGNWVTTNVGAGDQRQFIAENEWSPAGLWSDGATMWVGDELHSSVHALDLRQLRRGVVKLDRDRSFTDEELRAESTLHPGVVTGYESTLWIYDSATDSIDVYDLATKRRTGSISTLLNSGGAVVARGLWTDGETLWISGPTSGSSPGGVFTVDLAGGAIERAAGYEGVGNSSGLWSDGITMWVAPGGERKLQAFELSDGARDADRDIDIGEVVDPAGVWSDGEVIWVSDLDRRIASYCLTESCVARHIPEPPGADFPGDQTTAGRVEVGGSVTGRITPDGDVDWFAVYLDRGSYRFTLSGLETAAGTEGGPLPDPALRLLDFGGNEITDPGIVEMTEGDSGMQTDFGIGDDNSGGANNNSLLEVAVKEHHYYYVVVKKGGTGTGTGAYRLSIEALDCAADTTTTCEMDVGVPYGSEIETPGDRDWIRASLTADRIYQIDVKGASRTGGGTLIHPKLSLYTYHSLPGTFNLGGSNYQGAGGHHARYIYRAGSADATIYIEAQHNGDTVTGTYTVALADVTDQNISEPANQDFSNRKDTTLGQALNGARVTGSIATDGNHDWFRAPLNGGRIYQIDVKGDSSTDGGGTLANAGLTLYDASGTAITDASTNRGGADNNARRIYRADSNQTIYIEARDDNGAGKGSYTVARTDVTNGNISEPAGQDFTNNKGTTLGRVVVGGTVVGAVDSAGDVDRFMVNLERGFEYRIELRGSPSGAGALADPKLTVVHSSGGGEEENNDISGSDKNSRIDYRVGSSRGGNHSLIARSWPQNGTGTYTLSIQVLDCAATTATTCEVEVDGESRSAIGVSGDKDWFSASLTADRIYRIDVKGASRTDDGGTLANAGLTLYDASGTAISGASTNTGGDHNNARYIYRPGADGTIYIEARDDNGAGSGSYTVALTDVTDQNISEPAGMDFTNGITTLGQALPGGSVTGDIDPDIDEDAFRVNLTAGEVYWIDLKGADTGDGTLVDPLVYLHDVNSMPVTEDDNSGSDLNAQILYSVPTDGGGDHTITALSADLDTGTYTLTLTVFPSVAVGGVTTGKIEDDGDTERFRASLTADRIYQIDVKGASSTDDGGTLANAGLTLYDDTRTAISGASNNTGGDHNNARYIYRPATDETIYIEARDDDGIGTGTYTVALTDVTDQNISEPAGQDFSPAYFLDEQFIVRQPTPLGRVLVGGSVTGEADPISDNDAFGVNFTAGETYRIDLKGAPGGYATLGDPHLFLYEKGNGTPVAENDNYGSTLNAQIVYTVPNDGGGDYLIGVEGRGVTADAGTYILSVTQTSNTRDSTDDEVEPPSWPQNLAATVNEAGSVVLTWNDPKDASITGYQILRRNRDTSETGVFTAINYNTGSAAATYVDDEVEPGTRYVYRVRAINPGGLSAQSSYVHADTPPPPAVPQNLTATVNEAGSVVLSWDDPEDASITGYRILRRNRDTGKIGAFTAINDDTGSAATTYVDDTVEPGTRYVYKIKAINSGGLSARSHYVPADAPEVEPKANSPTTGQPAISGTAQVGETLTARTSGIEDSDGLVNATYSYQWLAGDAAIAGATGSSYTLVDADEGETIKVNVSFTDDAENEESLTSEPIGPVDYPTSQQQVNSPATGAPTIGGTVQVGGTLTAKTSGIEDEDGLGSLSFSYQWLAGDAEIAGATGSAYTLVDADEGETIKVNVSFTDDAENEESLTSEATSAVAGKPNSPATGAPTIGGTVQVGETLTANVSGIADEDGLDNAQFSYQWLADDTEITGATSFTHTLVDADEGETIKVNVSFTDDAGNGETLTSAATATVAAKPNSPATGAPAISGTAQVGETLTAETSGIADADGLSDATFSYQWLASDGTTDTDIQYATGSTHTLVDADEGKTIKVGVSFTDDAGNEETLSSAATVGVATKPNSPATGAPIIGGTTQVGETLTAETSAIEDEDGLSDVAYTYQWLAADTEIAGATSSRYTLANTDEGKTIKVRVTFADDAGNDETLTSAATVAVAAKPNSPATGAPMIDGTVQVGETLTADVSGIEDADGLETEAFSYRWLADDIEITGATGSSYTLTSDEEGKSIRVGVSFTDDASNEESLTSEATVAVMAAEPEPEAEEPPAQPKGLSGTVTHDAVSLSWNDPEDDRITGYQVLRRNRAVDAPGQFQVQVDDTGSADAFYVDTDVTPETRYVYRIKAINAAGLSKRSDYFGADTPPAPNRPATGLPTISGTAQVGETLTVDTSGIVDADGLDNAAFSYQWVVSDGGSDLDIGGARGASYTLLPIDAGLVVMVRVSFTDDAGHEERLTSAATAVVAEEP